MSLLNDYVFYNSGNECPQAYHLWACLAGLSTVVSRKIWLQEAHDYYQVFPNIYVALVGDAGSGKNTAKDCVVYKLLLPNFPDIPISASVTSREDVAKFMGSEDGLRTFYYPDGEIREYRPFFFAVSELSNLLSVDMRKMVDFLVDLYDSRDFSTSFKKDEKKDKVPNPCATMLAGCVPDWIMRSLKMDLFTGGLGRRLVIVYENRTILKAHPAVPEGGDLAWKRVVEHFKVVNSMTGPMVMDKECDKWWTSWYENPERLKSEDPILKQFYATKHVVLKKVAMLTALADSPPRMSVTVQDMIYALAMIEILEPSIKRLSIGIGRNEMASVSVELLNTVQFLGGRVEEKHLRTRFFRDCKLGGKEYDGLMNHLRSTDQLVQININGVELVFTPEEYERFKKEKGW